MDSTTEIRWQNSQDLAHDSATGFSNILGLAVGNLA